MAGLWGTACRRKWLDLRFQRREEEAAFTKTLEKDLLRSTWVGCALVVGYLSFVAVGLYGELRRSSRPFRFEAGDPRTALLIYNHVLALWHVLVAVAAFMCYRRQSRFRYVDWEVVNVFTWTSNAVGMCFGNRAAIASYYGMEAEDAFMNVPPIMELNIFLSALIVVSVLCNFVPVRLHKLWVMPVITYLALVVSVWGQNFANPLVLALIFVAVFFLSARQREVGKREAWQLIQGLQAQEKELQRRQGSTSRLLASFCDCVFAIGPDLRLVEPSKALASMLLRGQTMPKGADVCSLLKSEPDRNRFTDFVARSSSEEPDEKQPLPSCLTLDFCDATGSSVCVRAYLAPMCVAEGVQHLVGLVEAAERHYPESSLTTASTHSADNHRSCSECVRDSSGRASSSHSRQKADSAADDLFSHGTGEDSMMSSDLHAPDKPKNEPLCASVRLSADMEIVRRNDAFAAVLGSDSLASLEACMEDAEPFRQWLGQVQVDLMAGFIEPPVLREFGLVDVINKSSGALETMWLAVTLPANTEGSLKEKLLSGGYHVNIRLTEPTSSRALQALVKRRSSRAGGRGDASRLHGVVPALPGSL